MAKAKDAPKTGGRKKGVPNKITRDVREAIIEAFSELGGPKYLKAIAVTEPKAFCALLGRILPVMVEGDADNPMVLKVMVDRPPEETREQWLARRSRELGVTTALVVPQS
jgi:hypothetical protein